MLELIVVLAMAGILISLLLVAVQAARSTARRMVCGSNLRQVALAASLYCEMHGAFPPGGSVNGYSPHVAMLPYLEQQSLYDRIDFAQSHETGAKHVMGVPVGTFLCPADGAASRYFFSADVSGTNYAGNAGVWYLLRAFDGAFRYWQEPPDGGPPLRPADFSDGLSGTALFAEIPRADGTMAKMRVNWITPYGFSTSGDLHAFQAMCRGLPADPVAHGWSGVPIHRGTPWTRAGVALTLYTHTLTPNSASCLNGTSHRSAAATAGSFHRGGVNVAFADGHVTFIDDDIMSTVWEAFASRNVGDLLPLAR